MLCSSRYVAAKNDQNEDIHFLHLIFTLTYYIHSYSVHFQYGIKDAFFTIVILYYNTICSNISN